MLTPVLSLGLLVVVLAGLRWCVGQLFCLYLLGRFQAYLVDCRLEAASHAALRIHALRKLTPEDRDILGFPKPVTEELIYGT